MMSLNIGKGSVIIESLIKSNESKEPKQQGIFVITAQAVCITVRHDFLLDNR